MCLTPGHLPTKLLLALALILSVRRHIFGLQVLIKQPTYGSVLCEEISPDFIRHYPLPVLSAPKRKREEKMRLFYERLIIDVVSEQDVRREKDRFKSLDDITKK
ncbi:dihydrolipoyl dehydrogenase [Anopheles sinensis]|uniref:Dihydrolipoyl dehydrogenase n=1 Tax=Anopheles sinensis TaxID=74873 RepID=A0A084VRH1_ANOSI|nr:dihydrolipoyl dehydrogenase [Anopheles sinensis]